MLYSHDHPYKTNGNWEKISRCQVADMQKKLTQPTMAYCTTRLAEIGLFVAVISERIAQSKKINTFNLF